MLRKKIYLIDVRRFLLVIYRVIMSSPGAICDLICKILEMLASVLLFYYLILKYFYATDIK